MKLTSFALWPVDLGGEVARRLEDLVRAAQSRRSARSLRSSADSTPVTPGRAPASTLVLRTHVRTASG